MKNGKISSRYLDQLDYGKSLAFEMNLFEGSGKDVDLLD